MSKIFTKFPELSSLLDEVKKEIENQVTTQEELFNQHILRYFNENAKLLRPSFVLIAASYKNNYKKKENVKCAAAAEMLHVASLIHDDVIDKANKRRGIKTLNSEFDNGYAVICGDYLYAKSFELLFDSGSSEGIKYVGSNVVNMAFGEIAQYFNKFNKDITVEDYLEIISKKTATLFQANFAIGAKLAKISKREEDLLLDFGFNFGMMFQILDDVLDFMNQDTFKPIHNDILRGVYTLPVILCASECAEFRSYLNTNNVNFDKVLEWINKTDSIKKSVVLMENYYHKCCQTVEKLSNDKVKLYLRHITNVIYGRVQ